MIELIINILILVLIAYNIKIITVLINIQFIKHES